MPGSLQLCFTAHCVIVRLIILEYYNQMSTMFSVFVYSPLSEQVFQAIFIYVLTHSLQGAQEMFQELPHIYVEPHELRKAIQSTGMGFINLINTSLHVCYCLLFIVPI